MGNCLVTKLNVSVDSNDLPIFDGVRFFIPKGNVGIVFDVQPITGKENISLEYIVDDDTPTVGFTLPDNGAAGWDKGFVGKKVNKIWYQRPALTPSSTKDGYVILRNKSNLSAFSFQGGAQNGRVMLMDDITIFSYCKNLATFGYNPNSNGFSIKEGSIIKLEYFSKLTNLSNLGVSNPKYNWAGGVVVEGSVDDLKPLISLATLSIYNPNGTMRGDLKDLFDYWAAKGKNGNLRLTGNNIGFLYKGSPITVTNFTKNFTFANGSWSEA